MNDENNITFNTNEIRKNILVDLISRANGHNGYYEKLGINKRIMDSMDSNSWSSNLWALNKLKKNADIADKLIKDYQLSGNDLNNEVAFEELQTKVDKIFKANTQKYIILIVIVIVLLIIFL